MNRLLENSQLTTDLDGRFHDIWDVNECLPPPDNVANQSDPRLNDRRMPLAGSVTNVKVASDAGIQQSKLALDGSIPGSWLGRGFWQAAKGDLVEYVANKGQPNGYVPLDAGGRMPMSVYPVTGEGTVNSVGLSYPTQLTATPTLITHGAGTFAVNWASVPASSWLGNVTGVSAKPQLRPEPFTVPMMPNLDASQIAKGTFNLSRLPIAVGVGPDHAAGLAPDPGPTGGIEDCLSRDMNWGPMESPILYQPRLPNPSITFLYYVGDDAMIQITSSVGGVRLFYRVHLNTFAPIPSPQFQVPAGIDISAYAARTGFNNSAIQTIIIPHPRPSGV